MVYKVLSLTFVVILSSLVGAQKLTKEEVAGFWTLQESGFYENGKKIVKDFDNCRLMRNYALREDGFAIYNYIEGSIGNCIATEPRLSFWRVVENRIQFYIDDKILEEVEVTLNDDKTITFSSYIPKPINDSDHMIEKLMNTIHYNILKRY
ncbi:lipocalin-like domain-containing protein [Chryseobacterium oryctis]|uniref:Lipocalin family protein n=1 Tax=Chryseobacterium oryctis TaxID=2952618 RepID=A0ABT3HMW3_9FLAO|nr:lipocalin family protein [Chryseobacterium oryctis]MCW3161135.1 lipocalin family protein [Chryseobacterium oryctis]